MLKSFFEYRNPELKTDIISIDGNMLEEARKETVRPSKQFDYEDIDFLKQFPIEYYGQALHQRYNMLFNVLQRIHEMQQNLGFPELKNYLKIFLKNNVPINIHLGGVSERPKEHASKACDGETHPWVQIPPPPPVKIIS